MTSLRIAFCVLFLFALGCANDIRGRIEAQGTGDLIEPELPRFDPTSPMLEACGTPVDDAVPTLRRPYMQRVGPDRARILWVSPDEAPVTVRITRTLDEVAVIDPEVMPTEHLEQGVQWRAVVDGLEPATLYCYSFERGGEPVFGPIGFRTAPPVGDVRRVDVLAFGDSGDGGADQIALAEQMFTAPADVVIHTGDVVYPSGAMADVEAKHFAIYADLFDSIPSYPSLGNHDLETANGGPLLEAHDLPTNGLEPERHYSFDYGHVHFVALDTSEMDEAQARWLDDDLSSTRQPWLVVYAHVPPFSGGFHGDSSRFQDVFMPILSANGVHVVLSGHDHHYERFEPVDGVTYVLTGAGGKSTRSVSPRDTTAYAEPVTHFVSMRIEEDEMRLYAVDGVGRVFDSVRITR